ncbi:MAG: hypothetical protein Q7R76_03075 [Candidatus Woesearchaeota archaeon]|nr:hypothetical protein [Candidatus Woesearchaeota archaeon]
MEDMFKITLVSVAIMVLIATIAAVGLFSIQQQNLAAHTQVAEFKTNLVNVTKTLEENQLKSQNAEQRIKQLQQDLELVTNQNKTLQSHINQQNATIPIDTDAVYGTILNDISKLTIQNCPSVLSFASRQERDLRNEREDLIDTVNRYQRRLDEREADLNTAIAAGDQNRTRTEMERVDYAKDQVDEAREELDNFDDIQYSDITRLKSRAESWCRRIQRDI